MSKIKEIFFEECKCLSSINIQPASNKIDTACCKSLIIGDNYIDEYNYLVLKLSVILVADNYFISTKLELQLPMHYSKWILVPFMQF